MLTPRQEDWVIRGGIILYWWLFWLLNVVDKIIMVPTFLWVGKDRLTQFIDYFASIGITNPAVAHVTLLFVSLLELAALVFLTVALWHFLKKRERQAHDHLFLGILASLIVFSVFAIGDQIFGDRVELLEHSTYWIALVISWYIYEHTESKKKK